MIYKRHYFFFKFLGGLGKCQIRVIDGPEDRGSGLRPSRGHCRGQAQDGHDRLCMPDGQGLRTEHGQQKSVKEKTWKIFVFFLCVFGDNHK